MLTKPSLKSYQADPTTLGYAVFGPLFFGMAHYILETARNRGYKKLFFVSRDGYYMKAAYDELARNDDTAPSSHYLISSRKIANASAIDCEQDILRIADVPYNPCSLKSLLVNRFNLTENECKFITPKLLDDKGFDSIDSLVKYDLNHGNFVALALSQQALLIHKSQHQRELYLTYLSSKGLIEPGSCIVDIGYSGTLQSILNKITKIPIGGIYFITWQKSEQLDDANLTYDSFLGHKVSYDHQFNRYIQLFELVFSATHPSVIGMHSAQSDSPGFLFDTFILPQQALLNLALLRNGAMDFVATLAAKTRGQHGLFTELKPRNWAEPAFSFFSRPNSAGATHFKNIFFEDAFGGEGRYLCVQQDDIRAFTEAEALSNSCWTEGTKALFTDETLSFNEPAAPVDTNTYVNNGVAYSYVDLFDGDELSPGYSRFVRPLTSTDTKLAQTLRPDLALHGCVVSLIHDSTLKYLPQLMEGLSRQLFKSWDFVAVDATTTGNVADNLNNWQHVCASLTVLPVASIMSGNASMHDLMGLPQWFAFVPPGTVPRPDLLAEFTMQFVANKELDFVYSDHMFWDSVNHSETPVFKPDWSPELLISEPYVGSVYAVRREILNKTTKRTDFSTPHYFYQHLLEISGQVACTKHIPSILWDSYLSWGETEARDSLNALTSMLTRLGIQGSATTELVVGGVRQYVFNTILFPDTGPSVAILIPTKNRLDLLSRCLESLAKTHYDNYKIYIIDNDSDDPETLAYLSTTKHQVLRISSLNGLFNYSYINNQAVEMVNEDYILFLNNDTEVISSHWLSQMVGWLGFDKIGSVGARLLYEDGKIQHAGIVNGLLYSVLPAPSYKLLDRTDPGYLGHALAVRNYSAMTAACMLTPRALFLEMGGFNEQEFGVAYNDCDYGFRLTKLGYRHVYCPHAELYHYEGKTRGIGVGNDKPSEEAAFVKFYSNWIDPYYNPNLANDRTDFGMSGRTVCTRSIPKIRVLFATHNLNYEGAPLILFDIARGIHSAGTMDVVVLSPCDGPLRERFEAFGIQVCVLDKFEIFNSRDVICYDRALAQIRDCILGLHVDVVFANTILCWWAIDAATDITIPSIWCIHESEEPFSHFDIHGSFLKQSALRCIRYPYQVVFVAYSTRELFEGIRIRNNMSVIQNGFDPSRLIAQTENKTRVTVRADLNIAPDELMILTIGTVCERKNQVELIKALRCLPDALIEKIRVLIVGDRDGDFSRSLHSMITELPTKIAERISVIPQTSEVGPYYLGADIFVLTSRLESFPVVVQEAMYFSLPIVANPTFGVREQVRDGSSALYYQLGDVSALSNQLKRLIESEALRIHLGNNAKISLDILPSYENMVMRHSSIIAEAWLSGLPRKNHIFRQSEFFGN